MKKKSLSLRDLTLAPNPRAVLKQTAPQHTGTPGTLFQPRAEKALQLALHIPGMEHNLYIAGDPGLGRSYLAEEALRDFAKTMPTPPDMLYVNNFKTPDNPLLVFLPAGEGRQLREGLQKAVKRLQKDLPRHFEQTGYIRSQNKLLTKLTGTRDALVDEMEDLAQKKGFSLHIDDTGTVTLLPLVDGKALTPEDYDHLETALKKELKEQSTAVLNSIADLSRQVSRHEQNFRAQEHALAQEHARGLVDKILAPLRKKFETRKELKTFFEAFREDVLEHLEQYQGKAEAASGGRSAQEQGPEPVNDSFFQRYEVNLFVDNTDQQGAPVVIESNPGFFNLLGCVERETEWGTYYTDFSLIKAGALHRAQGGFLVLRADDLLGHPLAWEGLLRCLRTRKSQLDDPTDHYDLLRTRTITPEPVPLDLKVVLIGDDETYELLYLHDERFRKIFKVKAHIQGDTERTNENIQHFAGVLERIAQRNSLRAFTKEALAELVNYASRMAEDREKLSLHFSHVREVMLEANALALKQAQRTVNGVCVKEALRERDYRNNLYKEEFLHEYDRKAIKVHTQGQGIGLANGLSVTQIGEYVMGLPHQIACTVGVGHGGLMDLEREAELGGPIHTKGMMILKSYLVNLFASDKPLVFTGSLCFEQSYAQVDGDSASGAELAALLSALSGIPLHLNLAFTGAISQSGAIMAVGGVTHKVEGFFEVCRRRGLTGNQGVLLPADNTVHLVLQEEILDAVRAGSFHIYPVRTIEEAMEILTGVRAGQRLKNGRFSPNSLYAAVDERLSELAALADEQCRPRRKPRGKTPGYPPVSGFISE